MKQFMYIILINALAGIFQLSFFNRLFGGHIANPNLILALAFSLFFLGMYERAYFSALFGGLLLDLMSFNTVGLSSLILIFCLISSYLVKKYIFKGWVMQVLSLLITYFIYQGLVESLDIKMLFGAFFTLVFGLLFYLINQPVFTNEQKYS